MADTIVNLASLFSTKDETKSIDFLIDMTKVELNNNYPFYNSVKVTAELEGKESFVLLKMNIQCPFKYPCDRCAEIIDKTLNYNFEHKIVAHLNKEYSDEYIVADKDCINLSELVAEDILLKLPSKILCREDCKGLCPICGQNLNYGVCSCDTRTIDPRLEKLKELLV